MPRRSGSHRRDTPPPACAMQLTHNVKDFAVIDDIGRWRL
jgi:hypothetical protein